ncbi:ribonuclease H, partial [Leptinotarsa decemlineata]|uniref:ribonuclease H n=1 Tax=Leptinotarsa decemlineata TaxID=7539 RepID=UPI003D304252
YSLKRLSEAERRAKLLKLEVKSIRQEIASLHNSIATEQNQKNIININIGQRVGTRRSVILIDPLPGSSTTETDGPAVAESSGSSFVESSTFTGPAARKKLKASFNKEGDHVIVYTDGSCENNGKSNAKAGIGVWFGDNHPLNISKPVEGKATNNTAEIQACIQALHQLRDQGEKKVKIITDSQFTINCITKWINNWKRNNWKTASGGAVKNKEDLQKLDEIIKSFSDVKWHHVAGHQGIKGNEEADKLARNGALSYRATRK